MKFHFIYHNGTELIFKAAEAKHYTGHVVLLDAELVGVKNAQYPDDPYYESTTPSLIPRNKKFSRLNLALNGNLLGMYPEEEEEERKPFIANCTGWCSVHKDTLTTSGVCPKCDEIPF